MVNISVQLQRIVVSSPKAYQPGTLECLQDISCSLYIPCCADGKQLEGSLNVHLTYLTADPAAVGLVLKTQFSTITP